MLSNQNYENRMTFFLYLCFLVFLWNWVKCTFSLNFKVIGRFYSWIIDTFQCGFKFWCDFYTFCIQFVLQFFRFLNNYVHATFTNLLFNSKWKSARTNIDLDFLINWECTIDSMWTRHTFNFLVSPLNNSGFLAFNSLATSSTFARNALTKSWVWVCNGFVYV